MDSWKELKVGDEVVYHLDDFDSSKDIDCVVTEIHETHAIVLGDDLNEYWVDAWTEGQFARKETAR